ncbi:hypothetical protein VMCG_01837 [Cytospora schulzeri]|uniref:Rhodopsin domain-containing protein n=1 Tax=Cytospora schulzeri TaxID=448051 RepID=A0A423X2Y9_9PEZI|nr:hypothetical protein VMCG_01837 [Valsa malicola]
MADLSEASQPQPFVVKETPGAGRGAFATQNITAGGTILIADDLNAHILLREYRGEVCWECFAYDRGRKLPVRDALRGLTFCTTECEGQWKQRQNEVCLDAWEAVENLLKGGGNSKEPTFKALKPTAAEVDKRWRAAEQSATAILKFRLTPRSKRTQGKATADSGAQAFKEALSKPRSADALNFQLRALLARYYHPDRWPDMLVLAEEPCPYWDQSELERDLRAYLHLVCVLPEPLLPLASPETLRTVKTREVHNSFGIRSLEDEGSEFFGRPSQILTTLKHYVSNMMDSFMMQSGYAELAKTVHSIFASLTTVFLFTRLWARSTQYKGLWWDDYLLIAAWALQLCGNGLSAASPAYGFNILDGTTHGWTLTFTAVSSFYLATAFAKSAFAVTLIRISGAKTRSLLWFIVLLVWATSISLAVVTWLDIWPSLEVTLRDWRMAL